MTDTDITRMKDQIDAMSPHEMSDLWLRTPASHPLFQPPVFKYLDTKFKEKGGFNPSAHKEGPP